MLFDPKYGDVEVKELIEEDISVKESSSIVVFNDDHNTFDWVIECFVSVLGHSTTQAEQLSVIIHFRGKATVKSGDEKELKPLKDALVDKGLSAVIEH